MSNRLTKGKALAGAIDVPSNLLYINGTAVTATAGELNRVADVSGRIINGTANLTVSAGTHDSRIVLLNAAAGFDVTLPAATGSGAQYRFIVATTGTADYTINAAGDDTMFGNAFYVTDNAGTVIAFRANGGSVITLNGSATGGIKGDSVEVFDIAADTWFVDVRAAATGNEATPFS